VNVTRVGSIISAVVVIAAAFVGFGPGRDRTAAPRPVARAAVAEAAAAAAAGTPAARVGSNYETAHRVVSRDGGATVALPDGHDLWLFGDTGVYRRSTSGTWHHADLIDGSTSMLTRTAPGRVPTGDEFPLGVPRRFIPLPADVYLPDRSGRPCTYKTAAFPARWPTGAAMLTDTDVIVTYSIVCVTTPAGHPRTRAEGWGFMLYDWKAHHVEGRPVDVFEPRADGAAFTASKIFVSPVVADGMVTFFSSRCAKAKLIGCYGGQVWAASVKATRAALSNPKSYKISRLVTDGSARWRPLSISVGDYGNELRLVEMDSILGTYRIFTAPTAGARWHLKTSGTLPGCPTKQGFCIALEGHPELSTPGKTFVSYKDADEGPGGHIVASALPT
jgi:hypothetical protein